MPAKSSTVRPWCSPPGSCERRARCPAYSTTDVMAPYGYGRVNQQPDLNDKGRFPQGNRPLLM